MKIWLLKLKIKLLNKKIERNKVKLIRRLRQSLMDIKNAIYQGLRTDEIHTYRTQFFRINQETGECVDYLLYFPDFDAIYWTKHYLNAYLLTNRDVLEQKEVDRLEALIQHYD